ncbi:MAG: hypothetical protein II536_02300, partial [Clostridia bacterium]|nr:hypothetical protein [Clostridia bacterium]
YHGNQPLYNNILDGIVYHSQPSGGNSDNTTWMLSGRLSKSLGTMKVIAALERLVILAGHYEGLDERINELIDDEISIGDYVLTGGELPAMVLIDCVSRFIPRVLGCSESAEDESFSNDGLLEYPQYTRPADFRGRLVPEVLLNGNHAQIAKWRRQQSLLKTLRNRPELLERAELSKNDVEFLKQYGFEKA